MAWFIIFCALTVLGLASLVVGLTANEAGYLALGVVFLVIALLGVGLDSFIVVGARELAVQVRFGKVHGRPQGAGFHWVQPWNTVEKFNASVQTLKYYKDEKDDDGDCVTVRLGNSTPACVDVTVQWNIDYQGDVTDLYLRYKTFDNIHDNLVRRQLGSALNQVFGTYDPLAALTAGDRPMVTTKDLQVQVRDALRIDLGSAINVVDVVIPLVHFDDATEERLKAFQQAKADTRIGVQQEQTALAQARANKDLADQPAIGVPGVQYQNCLNLISALSKNGQLGQLPPTFTCNQGAGTPPLLIGTK